MATVTIPGALADYLTDQFISDDETRDALDAARRGRGRTLIIEPTSTRVLHVISRFAEAVLDMKRNRAQRDAARLWIERAGHAPAVMVHRFDDTEEAYDATQCRDDIRDGDVLVVEREGVVGFLRCAWPAAITAEHGELHTVEGDPRTVDDGRYTTSVEVAEKIAGEHGFALPSTADAEAQLAAEVVTEAEAVAGTWRGEWIGEQPAADALFVVEQPVEQGALFDDRATEPAATEPEHVDTVAPEVTRASVDAYLAREYPALFAPEQPQPLALPLVQMWAVRQRVVIRGEWQGLIMCGLGRREAYDRADVLRYTGSKDVQVIPCEHGPRSHREAQFAARCEGCGYQIPTGTEWHEACRPRPRPTPLDRARRAAEITAGFDRALDASAAVTDFDGEPPF
ncbi:hypothetical protein [Streptomyces sp. MBT53]|uniref:hypothetical protein n=1 Tax=Streptomyces sp. MBT53 TaxID=1488384 RepID=UPI001914BCF3|nr:hypothetical protein [Streptomyces sp. MBT53]MBK6018525.1 hypothetical protein [Streptomyces sp. MBT53]